MDPARTRSSEVDEPVEPDGDPMRPLPPPPTLGELVAVLRERVALRHPGWDATRAVLALAALVGLGGMVWLLVVPRDPAPDPAPVRIVTTSTSPTTPVTSTSVPAPLVVDVVGAVVHPGPVEVAPDARVFDAIAAAGGPRDDADLERVVRAARLSDGQRVYVPRRGQDEIPEPVGPSGGGAAAAPDASGDAGAATGATGEPVDLNTADADTLDTLPGVGPATAQAILDHRARNGPFTSVDELLEVKGIGPAKLAELRPHVTV